jgi:hypothetical protein
VGVCVCLCVWVGGGGVGVWALGCLYVRVRVWDIKILMHL